ncbi:MAG: cytochrome c [Acidobacteriota bacterium]|nr:cytochrome c [Acidobacteriota bacterium]
MGILPLALALGVLLAAPGPIGAEEKASQSPPPRGRILYRLHCSSCHGVSGAGDGTIADDLRVEPADLTRIAKRREGDFPRDEIAQIIDGRIDIGTHGTREMPIWGLSLRDLGRGDDQEVEVESQINLLVDYLASIQEPPLENTPAF